MDLSVIETELHDLELDHQTHIDENFKASNHLTILPRLTIYIDNELIRESPLGNSDLVDHVVSTVDGDCQMMRWGQVNVNFPGHDWSYTLSFLGDHVLATQLMEADE